MNAFWLRLQWELGGLVWVAAVLLAVVAYVGLVGAYTFVMRRFFGYEWYHHYGYGGRGSYMKLVSPNDRRHSRNRR